MSQKRVSFKLSEYDIDRFYLKLNSQNPITGCIEWGGFRNPLGYGMMSIGKRTILTHRIAWTIRNGAFDNEMLVLHKCDNPPYCNPDHLFLGTYLDNARDRDQKGRRKPLRGALNGRAKLSEARVLEIRAKYAQGNYTYRRLGNEYGISDHQARDIVLRKSWSHINE